MRTGLSIPLFLSALLAAQLIFLPTYSRAASCTNYSYNGIGPGSPNHPPMFIGSTPRAGIRPSRIRAGMTSSSGWLARNLTIKCHSIVPLKRRAISPMPQRHF
jgi:hypothetical protein